MSILMFLFLLLTPAQAAAPSCDNPRAAADSLLAWLQPERYEPAQAATCMNLPPELEAEGARLAVKLKTVLDARGYYVPVHQLSIDPNYTNELGESRLEPLPQLPEVSLEKVGDRWLYSRSTVEAIPQLYRDSFSGVGAWFQERLPASFSTVQVFGVFLWQLALALVMVAVAVLLARLLNASLLGRLRRFAQARGLKVNAAIFDRTRRPTQLLFISCLMYWGAPELMLPIGVSRVVMFGVRITMGLAAVWILLRWTDVLVGLFQERASGTETRMDDQVVPLIGQASRIGIVLLGVVFVLHNMGVDVASLIAGLGIGGLAVALAAQETLANVFGSLMIFMDRPFHVGDWVVLENGVEGTVEEVGFRSTRIRTFHNSVVVLPNAKVANGRVDNMGLREYRRFKTTLGLTYDTPPDQVQAFVEGVRALLKSSPDVRQDYYEVHFRDMGASALNIMVYCFFEVPDWNAELKARSRLLLEILRLAQTLGVSFAFPSQSLYLESTPERPLAQRQSPSLEELAAQVNSFGPDGTRGRPGGPVISGGFEASAGSQRGSDDG